MVTNEFGYPSCCIKFFYKGGWMAYSKKEYASYKKSVFFTSGYLPCPKCLRKKASKVIKNINKRRDPTLTRFAGESISSREIYYYEQLPKRKTPNNHVLEIQNRELGRKLQDLLERRLETDKNAQ